MPVWSRTSKEILSTAHIALQMLFNRVIQRRDCKVMPDGGARTPGRQIELVGAGASKVSAPLKSKHVPKNVHGEYDPEGKSLALDIMPYPVDWRGDKELFEAIEAGDMEEAKEVLENIKRHHNFTGYVMGVADMMKVPVRNGQDWDGDGQFNDQTFIDTPHWEIIGRP